MAMTSDHTERRAYSYVRFTTVHKPSAAPRSTDRQCGTTRHGTRAHTRQRRSSRIAAYQPTQALTQKQERLGALRQLPPAVIRLRKSGRLSGISSRDTRFRFSTNRYVVALTNREAYSKERLCKEPYALRTAKLNSSSRFRASIPV
jgi:hypothetical protein